MILASMLNLINIDINIDGYRRMFDSSSAFKIINEFDKIGNSKHLRLGELPSCMEENHRFQREFRNE